MLVNGSPSIRAKLALRAWPAGGTRILRVNQLMDLTLTLVLADIWPKQNVAKNLKND